MKIIPIEFAISKDELTKLTPEQVEESIKEEILKAAVEVIAPMIDDTDFIEMIPSEDQTEFIVRINLMVGSTAKYIDATSDVTKNLLELCIAQGVDTDASKDIIRDATRPLIDLIS
jgi:hypothetical protein